MLGNDDITRGAPDTLSPPARILIVDDSARDLNINAFALKVGGHQFRKTQDPVEARAIAREWRPDVIILDILMPEVDGITLAYQLRKDECDAELMFITSLTETSTKVQGLSVGDQYLTKPYDPEEMLAMIGALLRRRRRAYNGRPARHGPEDGLPVFDPDSDYVLVPHGRSNHLTRTERAVLRALVEAHGEPVSKEQLLRDIWHAEGGAKTVVEVYIYRVRRKIEINPKQPELVMRAQGSYYYNVSA